MSIKLLKDYLGLNGTHKNNIIICEDDDIYIPFKYTAFKTLDINVKTNYDYFIDNYFDNNVLIDSRMIKTITYIANTITDILIYDVNKNEVITLTSYVLSKISASEILNLNECVSILNLYVFVTFFCANEVNWNCDNCIKALNVTYHNNISDLGVFSIDMLLTYLNLNVEIDKVVVKPKYIDLISSFKMHDNLQPLNTNIFNIIYSLKELYKNTKYILI